MNINWPREFATMDTHLLASSFLVRAGCSLSPLALGVRVQVMQLALMHLSLIAAAAVDDAILRMRQPPLESQSFHLPVLQHLRVGLWARYTPAVKTYSKQYP